MNRRMLLLAGLILAAIGGWRAAWGETVSEPWYPHLADDRLQITLYAEHPDIVTPIGAAVDARGRLYVIESHTHNPPAEYDGPKGDLIKVFEGERPDGRAARISVFAKDLFQAQSLAFSPGGELYVVCTRGLYILHDRDDDGRSEDRTRILTIEPYETRANPHGQMQGIAFSSDGWVYVGRGAHVGGAYTWVGADGTRLPGGYDGGDIVRIREDGTQLERVATGFWNPFALTFDREGRLLAIDNDPDARGPNRLLHIIRGGDYGYRTGYGGYGLHPYQAWEGDLPGTLPMIAGVGEAPTGVIDTGRARLPADYKDSILVAVWGEHNLSLYRTSPAGSSIRAIREVFLEGEHHAGEGVGGETPMVVSGVRPPASEARESLPFRPSGLATGPDGSIFVSDWMMIDYTTHEHGRIWKVTARDGVETVKPRAAFAPPEPSPAVARLNSLNTLDAAEDYEVLRRAFADEDPFIRAAAIATAAKPVFLDAVVRDLEHEQERVRLGSLLALRRADAPDCPTCTVIENREALIRSCLEDSSPQVVQMAMIWAGEKVTRSVIRDVDQASAIPNLNKRLFETWLATMQILRHEGLEELYADHAAANRINRNLRPEFIERLALDERRPPLLRALALRWLSEVDKPAVHAHVLRLARGGDQLLQIEALRLLAASSRPDAVETLRGVAFDRSQQPAVRAEALLSLAERPDPSLLSLLDDPVPSVRLEAARALHAIRDDPDVRDGLTKKLAAIRDDPGTTGLVSQLEFTLGRESLARPDSVEAWQELLATGGDIEAGRRVFFSPRATCNTCHIAEGRGAALGTGFSTMPFAPDLSVIGRSANRQRLIESIIAPSNDIAPEMQGWAVTRKSGEVLTGRQIDQPSCCIELIMFDGKGHQIPREEVASWRAMDVSLMPQGLPGALAVEELRDLVAYLEALK